MSTSTPEVHVTIQNITPSVPSPALQASPSSPQQPSDLHRESTELILDPTGSPYSATNFPPVTLLLEQLVTEKPAGRFERLTECLAEAGLTTADQVLLLPEDTLSVIGDMGMVHARFLCRYAKRAVLPLLGMHGNYDGVVSPRKKRTKDTDSFRPTSIDGDGDDNSSSSSEGEGSPAEELDSSVE